MKVLHEQRPRFVYHDGALHCTTATVCVAVILFPSGYIFCALFFVALFTAAFFIAEESANLLASGGTTTATTQKDGSCISSELHRCRELTILARQRIDLQGATSSLKFACTCAYNLRLGHGCHMSVRLLVMEVGYRFGVLTLRVDDALLEPLWPRLMRLSHPQQTRCKVATRVATTKIATY